MDEQPNIEYIEKLANGQLDIKERLILVLKQEFPVEIAQYKENIASSNFEQAAENVHKIKHKIALLGLEKSYYSSQIYEQNLRNNVTNNQIDFETAIIKIQEFLKNI